MKDLKYYILDKDNIPVPVDDVITWAKEMALERQDGRRIVNKTTTSQGHYVSTVFLGLDHSWVDGVVHLFETMIFTEDKDFDEYCERYSTWKQAEEGHKRIVEQLEAGTFSSGRKKLTLSFKQKPKVKWLNLILKLLPDLKKKLAAIRTSLHLKLLLSNNTQEESSS